MNESFNQEMIKQKFKYYESNMRRLLEYQNKLIEHKNTVIRGLSFSREGNFPSERKSPVEEHFKRTLHFEMRIKYYQDLIDDVKRYLSYLNKSEKKIIEVYLIQFRGRNSDKAAKAVGYERSYMIKQVSKIIEKILEKENER